MVMVIGLVIREIWGRIQGEDKAGTIERNKVDWYYVLVYKTQQIGKLAIKKTYKTSWGCTGPSSAWE